MLSQPFGDARFEMSRFAVSRFHREKHLSLVSYRGEGRR